MFVYSVADDAVFTKHRETTDLKHKGTVISGHTMTKYFSTHLAVVFPDCQRELWIVENGAVEAVLERVGETDIAAAAVWKLLKISIESHILTHTNIITRFIITATTTSIVYRTHFSSPLSFSSTSDWDRRSSRPIPRPL